MLGGATGPVSHDTFPLVASYAAASLGPVPATSRRFGGRFAKHVQVRKLNTMNQKKHLVVSTSKTRWAQGGTYSALYTA